MAAVTIPTEVVQLSYPTKFVVLARCRTRYNDPQPPPPSFGSHLLPSTLCTMADPLYVDPDYWRLLGSQTPPAKPPVTDLYAIKDSNTKWTKWASDSLTFPAGMTTSVSTTVSADGNKLNITRFIPLAVQQQSQDAGPNRAIIYAFGGGLVAGSVAISFNIIACFAEQTGTQVFAPDYRIAPEHPYPAALDDVYAGITWLQTHAGDFNVDPARIVVLGQSAGGGIAAAAALRARDEALTPPIAAQVLRYPMLDDRTHMDPQNPVFPLLSWSPSGNSIAWKAYLGESINQVEGGSGKYSHSLPFLGQTLLISHSDYPIHGGPWPCQRCAWPPSDLFGCR